MRPPRLGVCVTSRRHRPDDHRATAVGHSRAALSAGTPARPTASLVLGRTHNHDAVASPGHRPGTATPRRTCRHDHFCYHHHAEDHRLSARTARTGRTGQPPMRPFAAAVGPDAPPTARTSPLRHRSLPGVAAPRSSPTGPCIRAILLVTPRPSAGYACGLGCRIPARREPAAYRINSTIHTSKPGRGPADQPSAAVQSWVGDCGAISVSVRTAIQQLALLRPCGRSLHTHDQPGFPLPKGDQTGCRPHTLLGWPSRRAGPLTHLSRISSRRRCPASDHLGLPPDRPSTPSFDRGSRADERRPRARHPARGAPCAAAEAHSWHRRHARPASPASTRDVPFRGTRHGHCGAQQRHATASMVRSNTAPPVTVGVPASVARRNSAKPMPLQHPHHSGGTTCFRPPAQGGTFCRR